MIRRSLTRPRLTRNQVCSIFHHPTLQLRKLSASIGDNVEVESARASVDTPSVDLVFGEEESIFKPSEIVKELNKFIVGQKDAKRAVSIAMRNRWRRQKLSEEMKNEVIPKNILMVGPTGCGKTEIARRIAQLSQAPFVKVEATKYTEVGFHGKDVDNIISDLMETMLLEILNSQHGKTYSIEELKSGNLDDINVVISVPVDRDSPTVVQQEISKVFVTLGIMRAEGDMQTEKKKMKVSDALKYLEEDAVKKICHQNEYAGRDASAEGVQRDLLPLIEGTSVSTKYGNVNTDYILFICSGAFHQCKPSDLLAELQGRLPIRVELKGLTEEDLYRILTEPVTNLIMQQQALLLAESVILKFEDAAIREIARVAEVANRTLENIGARRLHTIIERVVEEISFNASNQSPGTVVTVTPELVQSRVNDILIQSDLSKLNSILSHQNVLLRSAASAAAKERKHKLRYRSMSTTAEPLPPFKPK